MGREQPPESKPMEEKGWKRDRFLEKEGAETFYRTLKKNAQFVERHAFPLNGEEGFYVSLHCRTENGNG